MMIELISLLVIALLILYWIDAWWYHYFQRDLYQDFETGLVFYLDNLADGLNEFSGKSKHKEFAQAMTPVADLFQEDEWEWVYIPPVKKAEKSSTFYIDGGIHYSHLDSGTWQRRKRQIMEYG